MPGIRLQQVLAPDDDQLYTLYSSAQPGYAPHEAPVTSDATVSFVHVLSLQKGWAHCVGLPKMLWDRPPSEQALATSPNGRLLYVVNAALGVVSVMDTRTLAILRTERIGRTLDGITSTSAVVSDDGASLYVGAAGEVESIDTDSLSVADVWDTGDVTGLGLSSDGRRLYVAVGGDVKVLDAGTGAELGTVAVPSPASIDRLSTPAA
jgi:DNA-binding beta-propeller fold protein YncE